MLSDELLLLKSIDSNSSLSILLQRGYSYSQVANLLKKQETVGNIIIDDKGVRLTEAGRTVLNDGFKESQYKGKNTWILPQEQFYTKPISAKVIVLPKKL